MGTFSKLNRYRDAGKDANVNNVARFGEPVRSLFTSLKIFTIHHHIDITDNNEKVVYRANSRVVSIRDMTFITDDSGNEVCSIERKVFSFRAKHVITMADGNTFSLSTELLHVVKDIQDIKELGWKLKGNILGLNYELYDRNNQIVAVVGQKMISMHDKYCMDIYQPEYETYAVAILIAFQHMITDRKKAASTAMNQ